MSDEQAKIVNPELSINKKLGDKKFDQVFDSAAINRAEKTVDQSKEIFKEETSNDYENLKTAFSQLTEQNLDKSIYKNLGELAFSIKARATTGGMPLASEVANSMYKFCDAASNTLPANGYKVVKLHMDALIEVFENNFGANNVVSSQKLISGLEEISRKFLGNK